jgi:hypothetical protein
MRQCKGERRASCGSLGPKQSALWCAPTKEWLFRKHPIARATANGGGPRRRRTSAQMSGSGTIEPNNIQTRQVWVVVWATGVVVRLFTVPLALCCHRGTSMSGASTCRDGSRPANELLQKQGIHMIANIAIAPSWRRHWFRIALHASSSPMVHVTRTPGRLRRWLSGVDHSYASHRLPDSAR